RATARARRKNAQSSRRDYSASALTRHEGVDAALGLLPAPAAGALVVAGADRPGARPAANRLVALVEQRIVGNLVIEQVLPRVLARPVQERIDLVQQPLG